MKSLIVACLVSLAYAASPILPGPCPKVTTVPDLSLPKAMGLWWRPYRSQFNDQEAVFRCLRTGWEDLVDRTFTVIDYNIRQDDNVEENLYGNITARTENIADWDIYFTSGLTVNAQILDIIEDEYMFMFVCNTIPDDQHTNNGIVFTREQHPPADTMEEYMRRTNKTIKDQNLDGIVMLSIDLDNCPDIGK